MTDINGTVDRYIAVWNEGDPDARRALIARTWTETASYRDPLFSVDGPQGIDTMVAGFQQQFPGLRFRLRGAVETHNDRVRFGWDLTAPDDDTPIASGTDFAVVTPDGRLDAVTGFLDLVPAGLLG